MARIEAWLYGSGESGVLDATASLTIDEGGGAQEAILPAAAVFTDALADLATAINALGLGNTYSVSYDSSTQAVTIRGTGGPAVNFTLVFQGNLHSALGFSAAAGHTGATEYTGTVQTLGRFDDVKVEGSPIVLGPRVDLKRYRHGRHRAIAWSNHDLFRQRVWVPAADVDDYFASYCHTGKVRVYPTDVSTAYSATNPAGYRDLSVKGVGELEEVGLTAGEWVRFSLLCSMGR